MKKSVIILGTALVVFTNAAIASNNKPSVGIQKEVSTYMISPLHVAISKGDIESVKKIIEYGADVNTFWKDLSPLMVAARYNKFEIIKILLVSGAKPFEKNEQGFTALNYAQFSRAAESIAILKDLK
ncbi:ankyrin repeat domain-containing protein [Flavobacterium sp. MC2016-06]|uniref:ankyrin repeat domain-containing protein n=1 Tax=Flavobacterium sp. MC2016-06 TaxID=2676308 RepID=UPI0012BB092C|nr:ankyrin repeat domain-containing protein [Flavobacterium sp. MC2016-06]MBU3862256.1 ankyrin repeat domain-containing protein [Flavobacterium sp. MC2016-06]